MGSGIGSVTLVAEAERSKYVAQPKTSEETKMPTIRTKLTNHMGSKPQILALLTRLSLLTSANLRLWFRMAI
jgi:hypothetical protein